MKCTEYAGAYAIIRRKIDGEPTWTSVATAYDAGLRHALALSPSQRRHMQRLMRVLRAANREVTKS